MAHYDGQWLDSGRTLWPELAPNVGADSKFGVVDLDWYADIRTFNGGLGTSSDSVYVSGKLFWNAAKALFGDPLPSGHMDPYEDPKEKNLLDAMRGGNQSFADFFPEDFMKDNCPDPCEQ